MTSTTEIMLRRVLVGHRAAVNVVDFDEKYIVSASGDRTIKVGSYCFFSFTPGHNGLIIVFIIIIKHSLMKGVNSI